MGKAATPRNVTAGFEACGIYPWNPNRIPDQAFAPSEATEIPETVTPQALLQVYDTAAIPGPSTLRECSPIVTDSSEVSSDSWDVDYSPRHTPATVNTKLKLNFKDMLSTPHKTQPARKTRKAINSRTTVVRKGLFPSAPSNSKDNKKNNSALSIPKSKHPQKSDSRNTNESWFCFLCKEDKVCDVRLCFQCLRYVHEQCVGLTKQDKEIFVCPESTI